MEYYSTPPLVYGGLDIVPQGRWLPGAGDMCSGAHSADVAGIMLEGSRVSATAKKDQHQQKNES